MSKKIQKVAIFSRVNNKSVTRTIDELITFLQLLNIEILIEASTCAAIGLSMSTDQEIDDEENKLKSLFRVIDFAQYSSCNYDSIKANLPDLFVVVGGDGSMIGVCRDIAHLNIPVIGINKGHLGFLTDLDPTNFKDGLTSVLNGEYSLEHRFILETIVKKQGNIIDRQLALNETVMHGSKSAHMIDFSIFVDNQFMYSQKADGLIISTPTGSTAYNLSAGGPIISPSLNVLSVVPMFPHSMNCRPFIIDASSEIKIVFTNSERPEDIVVTCDGQIILDANEEDEVIIKKSNRSLCICHPNSYDYYKVLRSKLGFASKLVD